MNSSPEMFPCKISWSLIQLLSLTSSALWMSFKKKKKGNRVRKHRSVTDGEKKTFSNYSTRSPASLNPSVWWLHGFFFFTPLNGFLCCQPFQRDLPHLPHNPLTFIKYIYGGIAVWASKSLSIPHICTSAAAADSWHHNSLCLCRKKGCKGPRRSSHHISLSRPVSEIISGTDKLPGSYFYFFLFSSLVWNRQMLQTHWSWFQDTCTALLVPYVKSRSRPPSAFPGFIQGLSSYCLIHHCHRLQGKNHTDPFSIQQDTEAVLNPERALSRDHERQFLTVV